MLLNCDEGEFQERRIKNEEMAPVLRISMRKIDRVKKRFVEEGLETALLGRKQERVYDSSHEMKNLGRFYLISYDITSVT